MHKEENCNDDDVYSKIKLRLFEMNVEKTESVRAI